MTRSIRPLVVSALALGLSACGGAKLGGGKDGAAQAVFQLSQAPGRGHNTTGQALLSRAMASGATSGLTLSATCFHGGTAHLELTTEGGPGGGLFTYSVTYDACNEDGRNEFNGTLKTSMGLNLEPDLMGLGFAITHKGRVSIDGEISDTLDVDVKLTMDVSATATHAGSVRLVFDGTIQTSEATYVYKKETLSLHVGELPKA